MRVSWLKTLLLVPSCIAASIPQWHGVWSIQTEPIASRYIIQLRSAADAEQHLTWVKQIHARSVTKRETFGASPLAGIEKNIKMGSDFRAYTGEFDDETIKLIRASQDVLLVEQDQKVSLLGSESFSNPNTLSHRQSQTGVGYNLRYISQQPPASRDAFAYNAYCSGYAYVVDTGINTGHKDFEGRAMNGYNAATGSSFTDNTGHGTHVAGIIGSKTYGVCKNAMLIAVKVFSSSSASTSVILDGYTWAVNDIVGKGRSRSSVINFSLAGAKSTAFNNAVESAYNQSVLSVVASGNDNSDVSTVSPASAPNAITVGSIGEGYKRSSFGNYGPGLDIYAPGEQIKSTWIGSSDATNTISGSSMSAAHASGAALIFQGRNGQSTPKAVTDYMKKIAIKDKITGVPANTPNLLLYIG